MAAATPQPAVRRWALAPFAALSVDALYDLLRLRSEVFVVEQACPYLDPDGKDRHPDAHHLRGIDDAGALLAYCRLLPPGLAFPVPSIGRVVVAPAARGRGLAHALMREALGRCAGLWPGSALMLGAQQHLAGFYAGHGFAVASDMYLEDGIPHVDMRREAVA